MGVNRRKMEPKKGALSRPLGGRVIMRPDPGGDGVDRTVIWHAIHVPVFENGVVRGLQRLSMEFLAEIRAARAPESIRNDGFPFFSVSDSWQGTVAWCLLARFFPPAVRQNPGRWRASGLTARPWRRREYPGWRQIVATLSGRCPCRG